MLSLRLLPILLLLASACSSLAAHGTREMRAGCATCVYDMEGVGCPLAVMVDGKPVLVRGVPTPGHDTGVCDHEIRARVTGRLVDGIFEAEAFEALPN